jgi:hypothetical protein
MDRVTLGANRLGSDEQAPALSKGNPASGLSHVFRAELADMVEHGPTVIEFHVLGPFGTHLVRRRVDARICGYAEGTQPRQPRA